MPARQNCNASKKYLIISLWPQSYVQALCKEFTQFNEKNQIAIFNIISIFISAPRQRGDVFESRFNTES